MEVCHEIEILVLDNQFIINRKRKYNEYLP